MRLQRRTCGTPYSTQDTARVFDLHCNFVHPSSLRQTTLSTMASAEASKGTFAVKVGLAQMLKGGVIMDVVNEEQARIAEEAGAVAGTQPMWFALLRITAASASPGRRACRARVPTQ